MRLQYKARLYIPDRPLIALTCKRHIHCVCKQCSKPNNNTSNILSKSYSRSRYVELPSQKLPCKVLFTRAIKIRHHCANIWKFILHDLLKKWGRDDVVCCHYEILRSSSGCSCTLAAHRQYTGWTLAVFWMHHDSVILAVIYILYLTRFSAFNKYCF